MSAREKHFYEFDAFRLDAAERVLLRDGRPVPLAPKVFDTLLVLVRNHGHVVCKDELMKALWPDTFVEEGNLTFNIAQVRKALGEAAGAHKFIETVPRRGYRFVAGVTELWDGEAELVVRERTRSDVLIEEEEANGGPQPEGRAQAAGSSAVINTSSGAATAVGPGAVSAERFRRKTLVALALLLLILIEVAFGLYKFGGRGRSRQSRSGGAVPFAWAQLTRLTKIGNVSLAAVSPDGKSVAYVVVEAGRQGMWLRQVATGSSQQIIPPADVHYTGLTFSRDGNYVYFGRAERVGDTTPRSLYRVPAFGGPPAKLLEDIDWVPAFSADGSRLAFIRKNRALGESELMIANADGTGERRLAARKSSEWLGAPAWSPDGRRIAYAVGNAGIGGANYSVIELNVEEGAERTIISQRWTAVGDLVWLPDGSGILATAREKEGGPTQIWHVSYPGGEVRVVTRDSNHYYGLSLTADAGTLVAMQTELVANVWVLPDGDVDRATQITPGTGAHTQCRWTPDGRVVYTSFADGNPDVWVMNADGSGQKKLTFEGGNDSQPAVSPDGRYVAFVSDRAGAYNVWRMNSEGSDPVRLTGGDGEQLPSFSPDGRWLIYTSVREGTTWKVAVDGGAPVRLTEGYAVWATVSPDGKWLAYFRREGAPDSRYRIAVSPIGGGPPDKIFDLPPQVTLESQDLRWTPDGRVLTYAASRAYVSNIWSQPLDGGSPQQLTDFNSDGILSFDWSRDGRWLACSRGVWASDIVLITSPR